MIALYEQMDIFSFIEPHRTFKAGEYIDKQLVGKQIDFDEITQRVGQLIVLDRSTQNHEWFMVVLVEKITMVEVNKTNQRGLVFYDGKKQRGIINEMYFDPSYPYYPKKAFELKKGGKDYGESC